RNVRRVGRRREQDLALARRVARQEDGDRAERPGLAQGVVEPARRVVVGLERRAEPALVVVARLDPVRPPALAEPGEDARPPAAAGGGAGSRPGVRRSPRASARAGAPPPEGGSFSRAAGANSSAIATSESSSASRCQRACSWLAGPVGWLMVELPPRRPSAKI